MITGVAPQAREAQCSKPRAAELTRCRSAAAWPRGRGLKQVPHRRVSSVTTQLAPQRPRLLRVASSHRGRARAASWNGSTGSYIQVRTRRGSWRRTSDSSPATAGDVPQSARNPAHALSSIERRDESGLYLNDEDQDADSAHLNRRGIMDTITLTTIQVALILSVSCAEVKRLARLHVLPVKVRGPMPKFDAQAVLAYVKGKQS